MAQQQWKVTLIEGTTFSSARGRKLVKGQPIFTSDEDLANFYRSQGSRIQVILHRETGGQSPPSGGRRSRADVRGASKANQVPDLDKSSEPPEEPEDDPQESAPEDPPVTSESPAFKIDAALLELARIDLTGVTANKLLQIGKDLGFPFTLKKKGKMSAAERQDLTAQIQRKQSEILASVQS